MNALERLADWVANSNQQHIHRAIDGMIELMVENDIDAADIKKIEIDVPDRHAVVASYGIPKDCLQAKFSFLYCLAVAALNRSVTPQHFLDEVIEDAAVKAIMARVIVKPYLVDPGLDDLSPEAPDIIRVYLNNGAELEKTVAFSRGSPEKPLTCAQLFEKFRHCTNTTRIDMQQAEDVFNRFAQAESIMRLIRQLNLIAS